MAPTGDPRAFGLEPELLYPKLQIPKFHFCSVQSLGEDPEARSQPLLRHHRDRQLQGSRAETEGRPLQG